MIWTLFGWATVVWIAVVLVVVCYAMWRATRRPWLSLYPDVPVPGISASIGDYEQDNPFPWI